MSSSDLGSSFIVDVAEGGEEWRTCVIEVVAMVSLHRGRLFTSRAITYPITPSPRHPHPIPTDKAHAGRATGDRQALLTSQSLFLHHSHILAPNETSTFLPSNCPLPTQAAFASCPQSPARNGIDDHGTKCRPAWSLPQQVFLGPQVHHGTEIPQAFALRRNSAWRRPL